MTTCIRYVMHMLTQLINYIAYPCTMILLHTEIHIGMLTSLHFRQLHVSNK